MIDHPHLPLTMTAHRDEDYNLHWKGRRAGFVDRRQEPDGSVRWEIYLGLKHPDGAHYDLNDVAASPQEAAQHLRDHTPRERVVPVMLWRALQLIAS